MKMSLPHLTRMDKGTQNAWIRNHITGVLIHGTMDLGKDVIMYITTPDIPADSNLTINILIHSLQSHVIKYKKVLRVLYLQFDNCWRESKNRYVISFAHPSVACGIIEEVSTRSFKAQGCLIKSVL